VTASERRAAAAIWIDVLAAFALAVAAFNVHVSTDGDALSSLARTDRRLVYGCCLIAAAALLGATVLTERTLDPGLPAYFAVATIASLAALLLDVRDGPVRTVQLTWLLGVFLLLIGVLRLVIKGRSKEPE